MTRELVERRNSPAPLRAAARWRAPTAPSPALRALGASVRMLLAGALRHLATLLNGPEARLSALTPPRSTGRARCVAELFTDVCTVVAHAVGVSCEAEVPVPSSAPAEAPDPALEGPATEPSPLAHSVRPPETAVDVGDLAAETLRSSGVSELQRFMTLAPERGATASERTIATIAAVEASPGRTRLVCNLRTSVPHAMAGACTGAGR
jgi:hypothetical protein